MLLTPRGAAPTGPGGPRARLGYCLNLHASETLDDVTAAIGTYVLGVRDRVLGARSSSFGVGMYLGADVARALASDDAALADLAALLAGERIDPFTFNAFPYGGFQVDGLKERVYAPAWTEPERLAFTVDVARVAVALRQRTARAEDGRDGGSAGATAGGADFVSISTHPGAYGPTITDRSTLRHCAENFGRAVGELARLEDETGCRVVLSIEPEPDASARNGRALAEFGVFARLLGGRVLRDEFGRSIEDAPRLMERHLGACLDCCHSAVEFEDPGEALRLASLGGPLGKIQFSSALRLPDPGGNPDARDALLDLAEPRFLHQVTANATPPSAEAFLHLPDLPALRSELESRASAWHSAAEWRCHFHVPVDLEGVGGLGTTRAHADAILGGALADPSSWKTPELHVEIETYTWSVLPAAAGDAVGEKAIIEGLEREYAHVLGVFETAGWRPAAAASAAS